MLIANKRFGKQNKIGKKKNTIVWRNYIINDASCSSKDRVEAIFVQLQKYLF